MSFRVDPVPDFPDRSTFDPPLDRPPVPILQAMRQAAVHETTEMAAMAGRFVNSTARHVFLTGKAGTGKTTFLRKLAENTHKRFLICAPTGIAALNAGGVTIHSQFLLPFGSFIPEKRLPAEVPAYGNFHDRDSLIKRHPLNALRRNVLQEIDLLVIDEVSMLRADLLDAIDLRMRSVKRRWDLPFGGVQLLLIGDLYQLPPVVKDAEWHVLRRWYGSVHFFSSRALQESGYVHIELDKIFRQKDDRFIRILNNLREDNVTAGDVAALNAHYRPVIGEEESKGVITLTTHNHKADQINQQELARLPGEVHRFSAEIEGDFPESMFPVLRELELKEGAQIMFTRNDPEKAYFNGKLAQITSISGDGIDVRMIDDGSPYTLKKDVWENKRYTIDPVTREQKEEMLGEFTQYPVKLAWAITVHKSQGLTFDRAIIDVGQAFAPGQVYVALSRLRSLDGLILRTRIDPSVVSCDREVIAFSGSRHQQPPLTQQLREQQVHFLRSVLTSTFDLGDLLVAIDALQKEYTGAMEFEDEAMRKAVPQIGEGMRTEVANTQRFQAQLMRLLAGDEREDLLERIRKGADYYERAISEWSKELLKHLAQAQELSRTREYTEAVREIDGMFAKKLAMLARSVHITTCILNGEEVSRPAALERTLKDRRTAMVEEVRAWAAENRPSVANRSGRKRKPKVDDDTALDLVSQKAARGRKLKGETYLQTYALLKNGRSIAEVAAERGLSVGTIESHVARGIGEGIMEIGDMMPADAVKAISDWMKDNPDASLKDARANFGTAYSFGRLRMVQAWLKKEDTP